MDDDSITDMHGDLQHLWVSVQLTTCRGRWHIVAVAPQAAQLVGISSFVRRQSGDELKWL